jgi:SAM-dependent methyltransferase
VSTSVGAPEPARAGHEPVGAGLTTPANRAWWDAEATAYLLEHGDFLGDDRLVWCPEGLDEDDARLLGDVAGLDVVEVGCGAAQGTRWAVRRGARAIGVDLSAGMLARSRELDARTGVAAPVVQADATRLPLADAVADLAFTAYGALPFVEDAGAVLREVARVLRPGGRFVAATTHPVRWAFPDDPGPEGLTAYRSYFDRTPYAEHAEDGSLLYAEHHRTVGDWVRLVHGAGLVLEDVVEPEWPEAHRRVWGGWSPLRGRLLPGTLVLVCRLP